MCEGHASRPNERALTIECGEREECVFAIRTHITEITAVESWIMLVIEDCCIPNLPFRVLNKSSMYCLCVPREL
jgi:hypothetical protein